MGATVIKAENLSKQYRLGNIGTGTLSHDLNRLWYKIRGKDDPYLKIGEANDRATAGASDYVWSLRDISFEVKQGEVLGIIGKNGAGKSTLLKILSRVTQPTTGVIKTKGRIASLLEVGTGFHPELSGRENIFLNGAILGMSKQEIRNKFDEIVEFSGVERYIDTPVKRYSSGMYVRLAFAVAAHLEPEILVIDEVLAVGDAEFQKKCLGKMKEVSGQGRTVLFVSHNLLAVKNLCTSGIYLKNGQVHKTGHINEVVNFYLKTIFDRSSVSDYTHIKQTASAKIEKVIVAENGSSELGANIFQSVKIEFVVEAKEIIPKAEIFVLIYNSEEQPVSSLFQRDSYSDFDIPVGKSNFVVEFNNALAPGTYYLSAGIFNEKKEFVDWVEHCEVFVSNAIFNDGKKFDSRIGMNFLIGKWTSKN
ncbi:MAG: ABC transporter ATP-binding protein [Bacteroidia bacterium]|nr:ABC transporter ATP-binding protein [Bacteroidia bacterium]